MSEKKKRITKMLEIITTQRYATIPELAASFEVSEMTIRRDLEVLEGSGMIKVVRGTAIPNADINQGIISSPEYNLVVEVGVNTIEKSNIGKFAVSLIKPGDSIILDTGTTTEQALISSDSSMSSSFPSAFSFLIAISAKSMRQTNLSFLPAKISSLVSR